QYNDAWFRSQTRDIGTNIAVFKQGIGDLIAHGLPLATIIENGIPNGFASPIGRIDEEAFSIEMGQVPGGRVFVAVRGAYFGASFGVDTIGAPSENVPPETAGQHVSLPITVWQDAVNKVYVPQQWFNEPGVEERIRQNTAFFDSEVEVSQMRV